MSKHDEKLGGLFGNRPTVTGAGDKVFSALAHAFLAREATTITHFYKEGHILVDIGWAGEVIEADEVVWFGCPIESITVSVGGRGRYFLAKSDL